MIAKGLRGKKFFARVIAAEIACPRCSKVARLRRGGGEGWEPRLSRWTCQGCGTTRVVGMLLWPGREKKAGWRGGKGQCVPVDAVPSAEEAEALFWEKLQGEGRAQMRNLEVPAERETGGQANVEIEEEEG